MQTPHADPVSFASFAGKFYTLTTGANKKRWDKVQDKLKTVVKSFELINAAALSPA